MESLPGGLESPDFRRNLTLSDQTERDSVRLSDPYFFSPDGGSGMLSRYDRHLRCKVQRLSVSP